MLNRAHRPVSASFFHVTARSRRHAAIFMSRADYRAFMTVLQAGLARHPVKLISYCVMPNHWHLVLGPNGTDNVPPFVRWVTATHTAHWLEHHKAMGSGPVYEADMRADAVDTPGDLVGLCRHVERNALRARLVRRAQDWPWCSLSDRLRTSGVLPLQPAMFLASESWVGYVNAAITPRESTRDVTDHPRLVQCADDLLGDVTAADDHQADAHVECAKHLGVVDAAAALKPAKERRHDPALAIE